MSDLSSTNKSIKSIIINLSTIMLIVLAIFLTILDNSINVNYGNSTHIQLMVFITGRIKYSASILVIGKTVFPRFEMKHILEFHRRICFSGFNYWVKFIKKGPPTGRTFIGNLDLQQDQRQPGGAAQPGRQNPCILCHKIDYA